MANKDSFYRRLNALGFLICLGSLILLVLSFQADESLVSPLSSLIRLVLLCSVALFFLALIHNPGPAGQRLYNGLNWINVMFGLGISAYHLWLTSKPETESALTTEVIEQCQTPFEQLMMTQSGIVDKLELLSRLASYCSAAPLPSLPFELAGQALLIFVPLFIICWKMLIRKPRNQSMFL